MKLVAKTAQGYKNVLTGGGFGVACFQCHNCKAPQLGIAQGIHTHLAVSMIEMCDLVWIPWKEERQEPFRGTPAAIASAADETAVCLFAGAARGAVILARSVIEAVACDQGITQGSLLSKIDEMHARGLIRSDVRDAAHELRMFGNQMAHGDFSEVVGRDDAVPVLELMADVLEEVYGSRTRIDRHLRDLRLARGERSAGRGQEHVN